MKINKPIGAHFLEMVQEKAKVINAKRVDRDIACYLFTFFIYTVTFAAYLFTLPK